MTRGVVYWNDGRPVLVIRGRWLVLGPMSCREDVQAWCGWNRVQFIEGLPMGASRDGRAMKQALADSELKLQPSPELATPVAGLGGCTGACQRVVRTAPASERFQATARLGRSNCASVGPETATPLALVNTPRPGQPLANWKGTPYD
jgi:hypothetical protein